MGTSQFALSLCWFSSQGLSKSK